MRQILTLGAFVIIFLEGEKLISTLCNRAVLWLRQFKSDKNVVRYIAF